MQEKGHLKTACQEVPAEMAAVSVDGRGGPIPIQKMPSGKLAGKMRRGLADQSFKAAQILLRERRWLIDSMEPQTVVQVEARHFQAATSQAGLRKKRVSIEAGGKIMEDILLMKVPQRLGKKETMTGQHILRENPADGKGMVRGGVTVRGALDTLIFP